MKANCRKVKGRWGWLRGTRDSSGAGEEAAAAGRGVEAWGKEGCTGVGGKGEQRAEAQRWSTPGSSQVAICLSSWDTLREVLSAPKKQHFVFYFQASKLISNIKVCFSVEFWRCSPGVQEWLWLLEETFEMKSGLYTVVTIFKKIVVPKHATNLPF